MRCFFVIELVIIIADNNTKAEDPTIQQLRFAFAFVRPKIILTCSLIAGLAIVSSGAPTVLTLLIIPVLVAWYIHGATGNDYADRKIDLENGLKKLKNRPLLNYDYTPQSLWTVHAIGGIASLLLIIPFGPWAVPFLAIILLLDYAYSFRPFYIEGRGILSQLMLPIAYVCLPFMLGYWSVASPGPFPWLLLLALYAGFSARLFLKDFRDIKGDKKYKKHTFLVRYGKNATVRVSKLFAWISLGLSIFAVHGSVGATVALALGHLLALKLLTRLSEVADTKTQNEVISQIAKTGNASVLIIALYFLCVLMPLPEAAITLIPLAVGLFLQYKILKKNPSVAKYILPSFFEHLVWLPLRLLMFGFCHARIEGVDNVKKINGPVIFASNHVSELDPLMIVACLPFFSPKLPIIYVTRDKTSYTRTFTGWRAWLYSSNFFEIIGGFESYTGLNNYKKALTNHLQAIDDGRSICIFPVGRWHTQSDYPQARGGVAYLAHKSQLPVIPIHIQGIQGKISPFDYVKGKVRLRITFGEPLYVKDLFQTSVKKSDKLNRDAYRSAAQLLMRRVSVLESMKDEASKARNER